MASSLNLPQRIANHLRKAMTAASCQILRRKAFLTPRYTPGICSLAGFRIEYTDLLSLYMEYKDIFLHKIYHFSSGITNPRIIDGGGCIGMSVLYFKSIYPESYIICFEPDPKIFQILQTNIIQNSLSGVNLVQAGLSGDAGTLRFLPDGADGGRVDANPESGILVQTVRLSDHIDGAVDFLKLNIEGQEWPVLAELEHSGKLPLVKEMVIEYHGWPNGPQALGDILTLLDRNGFQYIIHDFDQETCPSTKPPFHLDGNSNWFCLVYGRRLSN